jgi:hypothetical protein
LGYTLYEIADAVLITCEARREWSLSLQNKKWGNFFAIAETASRNLKKLTGKDPQRAATTRDSNKVASPPLTQNEQILLLLTIKSARDLDVWAFNFSPRQDQEKQVSVGKGKRVSNGN